MGRKSVGKNSQFSPKVSAQTWPTFLIFPIPFLLDYVDYYSMLCHYSISNIDKRRPLTLSMLNPDIN